MKVLIVGAGIAGLTLADQLDKGGHSVHIVEKSPGLRTEGYMMDFFGAGYDVAERMRLLGDLETIHYPIDALNVKKTDGTNKYSLKYDSLRQLLNGRHFNFMRGDLERILYERIKNRVEIVYGTTVNDIHQDNSSVVAGLSNGTQLSCDLLVGADGIHSKVRYLVFGDEDKFVHQMGYQTAAFTFNRTSEYAQIQNTFDTITQPGRQISIYPIRGNRLATFFLFTHNTTTQPSNGEAIHQLKKHFGDMGWVIPNILRESKSVTDLYFDNVAQVEMSQWVRGRVALVGDACGCVSLVAGQGSSLAMAEAYTLARCLAEHNSDMQSALAAYETLMVPQITKIQRSARKFANYFFPDRKWKLAVRDITMRASVVPILRSFIKFKSVRLPK